MAVALAAAEYGAGPPLLILHGLFGSSTNWTAIARRLGEHFRVFSLDMRNHGASPWAADMTYGAMAEDVEAFIGSHGLGAARIIGHSMGGKAAMMLALRAPERVERLVVVDIAPTSHPPTMGSYADAMRALDLTGLSRRGAAEAQLRHAVPEDAVRLFLLQNLVPGPDGLRWRLNLAAISAHMAELSSFPNLPPDAVFAKPTLVVRGERSDYVGDGDLPAFKRLFPKMSLVTIPGAGHWVHAERSEEFLTAVGPFLAA